MKNSSSLAKAFDDLVAETIPKFEEILESVHRDQVEKCFIALLHGHIAQYLVDVDWRDYYWRWWEGRYESRTQPTNGEPDTDG